MAIVWEDMIQGGSRSGSTVSPTYNINYYCNGSIAVYNWYGYRYASQTAPQDYLNYWVKFYDKSVYPSANYADVYFSSLGSNVKSNMGALGMYLNGSVLGSILNTANAGYIYRVYFDGSLPATLSTAGSNFFSVSDFLSNLNATNYDDGYTSWTTASGQYASPTISFGAATTTNTSITIPTSGTFNNYTMYVTTGNYYGSSGYSYVTSSSSQTGNYTYRVAASSNQPTYYFTAYPYNDMGDSGSPAYTSASALNSLSSPTPGTPTYSNGVFSIPFSGGSGPWYQAWYQTSTGSQPSLSGTDASNPDAYNSYSPITKSLVGSAGYTYWWWVRSAYTSTGTGTGNVSTWNGPVSVTVPNNNMTTAPTYGSSGTVGGMSATVNNTPNPSGGTYALYSQSPAGATVSVNSSTGAISVSGVSGGTSISVTVSYSLFGYNTTYPSASATALYPAPTQITAPSLSGSNGGYVGSSLTASSGSYSNGSVS